MERIVRMLKSAQVVPVRKTLSLLLDHFTRLVHQAELEDVTVIDASLTACLARNTIELEIWLFYVLTSAAKATRLKHDFVLDFRGLQKPLAALFAKQTIQEALAELRPITDNAITVLKLPDVRYLPVRDAAEPGLRGIYDILNPIMSKLVHPTSLSIFADAKTVEAWHTMVLGVSFILLKLTLDELEQLPMASVTDN